MDQTLHAIQTKLKALGFDPGPLDGIWGDQTRDAVAAQLGIASKRAPVGSSKAEAPWFELALAEIGEKEIPGPAARKTILGYDADAGHPEITSDEVPWCAGFAGAMLKRAGYKPSGSLMARSYLDWGTKLDKPRRGCVVVFKRGAPPAGHVGFADDWTATNIRVLGGNQADSVSIAGFSRASILGYRWPSETLKG